MSVVDEAALLGAFREGRTLDCAGHGIRGRVDAAFLRRCCLELQDQVDFRGISLSRAAIVGCLDLAGIEVPFPLRFDGCIFDSPPTFEGANLHELALTGCDRLPGLLANGVQVRRDLDLSRSRITGCHSTSASTSRKSAIWLCESEIGGRILCIDTAIHANGERSLQADRMHVGGTIRFLHRFTAIGEIRLLGARIDGSLDLTGARIESDEGPALDLGDAVIGGSLFLISDRKGRRPVIRGRLDMGSTRISGQLLIRDATIEKSSTTPIGSGYSRSRIRGTALSAPRLSVGAEMAMEGTCQITGGLDLSMSDISSLTIHNGCSFHADGNTALDLTHAQLRSSLTFDSGTAVSGTVRLTGAQMRGDLSLRGAKLKAPEPAASVADTADSAVRQRRTDVYPDGRPKSGYALIADGVKVGGAVLLNDGFTTEGALQLRGAEVAGSLICSGAHFNECDQNGYTVVADEIRIGGNVLLDDGLVSAGAIRLPGADIGRALACSDARLDGQDNQGVALLAGGIKASGLYLNDGFTPAGKIWLRSANIRGSAYLAPEKPATGVTGLDAAHARIAGTFNWIPAKQVEGLVSLQGAAVGQLVDDWSGQRDNAFWPTCGRLRLDGLTYDGFGGRQPAAVKQRLAWIRSQYHADRSGTGMPFATQPYEQLAAVYRHAGQDIEARQVAIARRADLRVYGSLSRSRRAGNWLLDKTIKYGYQTWRAAAGLLLLYLIVLALSIFAQHHGLMLPVGNVRGLQPAPVPTRCAGNYPCFYPPGYAIDTVIPIINVHQASYWGPNGSAPWGWTWVAGTWIATALGWALATLLVAGYTGLARHK